MTVTDTLREEAVHLRKLRIDYLSMLERHYKDLWALFQTKINSQKEMEELLNIWWITHERGDE